MEERTNRHSYPALRIAALMATGVIVADKLVSDSVLPLAVLPLMLLPLLFVIYRVQRWDAYRTLLTGLLCMLAGGSKLAADRAAAPVIPTSFIGRDITVVGVIDDWPRNEGRRAAFLTRSEAVAADTQKHALSLLLNTTVLRARGDSLIPSFKHGMRVAIQGHFSIPRKTRNPGEISEATLCDVNGIGGFLFVRGIGRVKILEEEAGSIGIRRLVTPARQFILDGIDRMVGGEEGEFLKGLLIGERGGIPAATREAFALAGVAHILAVSGSNVAVIAAFLVGLLGTFRLPESIRTGFVAVGLVGYMVITGSQPPVVRATIMALTFLLTHRLQRKTSAYNSLGLSALVMLISDARQVFDIGFQLSFAAVFSILYFYPRLLRLLQTKHPRGKAGSISRALWSLASVTIAATVGTLPLTAVYFGRVSLVGLLTNLVVVPLSGASVILGCVSSFADLFSSTIAEAYASLNWILLRFLLTATKFSGGVPFAAVEMYDFRPLFALPYYAALFCVSSWDRPVWFRFHLIALLLSANLVVLAGTSARGIGQTTLRVTVLDVGQGDAVLCDFPGGKHLLVDTGPSSSSFDAGRRILVPYVKRWGIDTLDWVVITHGHSDHTGGLASLCIAVHVKEILVPSAGMKARLDSLLALSVGESRPSVTVATVGSSGEKFPGVRAYILYPETGSTSISADDDGNNASIVLRLVFGETSFLFPGDAETGVEDRLLRRFGAFLRSHVLKVSHHGSSTSTKEEFLLQVRPSIAVISVGRNNSFGHPSPEVLGRLLGFGCVVHRTDEWGAAVFESDGEQLTCVEWR
jgi:competence protein ComEC